VEFPKHRNVKAAIEGHLAMVHENQTDGCLPCHHDTAKNLQTCWRHKETSASPPKLMPPPPGTPPVSPSLNDGADSSEIEGLPPGYVYIHTPLPNVQFYNLNAYGKDHKWDLDFIPDLQTNEETFTG